MTENKPEKNDYISLYEFLEWSKKEYDNDLSMTAKDLLRLLQGSQIQLYRRYIGIKKTINKDTTSLKSALEFVLKNDGYEEKNDDFDPDRIPF